MRVSEKDGILNESERDSTINIFKNKHSSSAGHTPCMVKGRSPCCAWAMFIFKGLIL
jgi:hypothetical protein